MIKAGGTKPVNVSLLLIVSALLVNLACVSGWPERTSRWQTTESVPLGPYAIDLTLTGIGRTVTGSITQLDGPQPGPADIFNGRLNGGTLTFKARSPDGDRTVTFEGELSGDAIVFTRQVEVRPGGSPGGNGLFGVLGPSRFKVMRASGP